MPEIRPDVDMYSQSDSNGTWAGARNHAGSVYDSNNARDVFSVANVYATKGGASYLIRRALFIYETS